MIDYAKGKSGVTSAGRGYAQNDVFQAAERDSRTSSPQKVDAIIVNPVDTDGDAEDDAASRP